jgi:hydrogenase-4 component F
MNHFILIYFALGALLPIGQYFWRKKGIAQLGMWPFFWALQTALFVHETANIGRLEDGYFETDLLGLLVLGIVSFLSVAVPLHYLKYAESRDQKGRQQAIFHAGSQYLVVVMSGVCMSNHLGLLWAFMEASTLFASILIYTDRKPASLEAVWKYIFVASIGISFAFVGILLLALASRHASELNLMADELRHMAYTFNPAWLRLSFLLVLAGFSVKFGSIPLFQVGVDAKGIAPSPAGALLTGGLMSVGVVGLFRFYQIIASSTEGPWADKVLVVTGLASLAVSAASIIRTKNLKRLLSQSSTEHAGLILLAMASGELGWWAMALHVCFHALTKSAYFLQVGVFKRTFKGDNMDLTGDYARINPDGSWIFLLSTLALTGFPPSGLFLSEVAVFRAVFASFPWWVGATALALIILIGATLVFRCLHMLFAVPPSNTNLTSKSVWYESTIQWGLMAAVWILPLCIPTYWYDVLAASIAHL